MEDKIAGKEEELFQAIEVLNITLCRLYDVQMAILNHFNEEASVALQEAHEKGFFLGSAPALAPEPFYTPEVTEE